MPLACRVQWSWVDRTGDTVKEPLRRRARHATGQLFVDDQLQTFWQHLKCSLTTTETWRTWKSSGIFLFLFTQPAVWAWETWYSVVWASPSQASAGQQLWYLADGRMVFTFTLSNAESRGGRMNLKVLANVRRGWTDCRAATLTFFFFFWCLREEGEDSERGETKFSAGVTVKFTAPTTMHVEEKQPECSQRHSKCEQEHEDAGSFRLNVHRTVQTRPVWSRSVHDGIFPDVYFYTEPLGRPHERRPMASRREQVSALFFVAWTQRPLTESFPWATEGANPLKETPTFKKRIFWRPAPGSLPAGLKGPFSVFRSCRCQSFDSQLSTSMWRRTLSVQPG